MNSKRHTARNIIKLAKDKEQILKAALDKQITYKDPQYYLQFSYQNFGGLGCLAGSVSGACDS